MMAQMNYKRSLQFGIILLICCEVINPLNDTAGFSAVQLCEIEIDGEKYRLDEVPAEASGMVSFKKKELLGTIDLNMFVEDLSGIASLLRVAYYSATAGGFHCTDLRIKIDRIGLDIAKLSSNCEATVVSFMKASSSVLTDLQATYAYLLENEEELATLTLSGVSEVAHKMERASRELYDKIEKQAENVASAREQSISTQAKESERIQQHRQLQIELEEKQHILADLIEKKLELEREAKADRLRYEAEEDKEVSDIGNPIKHLMNGITSVIGIEIFDEEAPARRAAEWKEKRKEALQLEEQYRQQRYEANEKKSELTAQISECHSQEDFARVAELALHLTIGALKHLSLVMLQAAKFWQQIGDHCSSLAESKMQAQVKTIMSSPPENRQKQYTSTGFITKAISFYAEWVALHSVCSEYIQHIKDTQKKLTENIKLNPTSEQARHDVKPLAEALQQEITQAQDAIIDKAVELQKKKEEL